MVQSYGLSPQIAQKSSSQIFHIFVMLQNCHSQKVYKPIRIFLFLRQMNLFFLLRNLCCESRTQEDANVSKMKGSVACPYCRLSSGLTIEYLWLLSSCSPVVVRLLSNQRKDNKRTSKLHLLNKNGRKFFDLQHSCCVLWITLLLKSHIIFI